MIRRPPRSTLSSSSAASDVYKRQVSTQSNFFFFFFFLMCSRTFIQHLEQHKFQMCSLGLKSKPTDPHENEQEDLRSVSSPFTSPFTGFPRMDLRWHRLSFGHTNTVSSGWFRTSGQKTASQYRICLAVREP
eukprot:TRINITY_DN1182_c0_g1_i18.p1 TRINITY_DN1182_c0_g1~~TRINITY_DN1182_c0_g1_i18.p1  ORF type:complete len:132 (+),score=15.25 TRINITY_DN1182_c0_g1_i18:101-496(+)